MNQDIYTEMKPNTIVLEKQKINFYLQYAKYTWEKDGRKVK